jgi:hypothetical protein
MQIEPPTFMLMHICLLSCGLNIKNYYICVCNSVSCSLSLRKFFSEFSSHMTWVRFDNESYENYRAHQSK